MSTRKTNIADKKSPPTMKNQTLDLGNNEQISRGIFPQADGTYLAMTFSKSKTFKSRVAAEKWLAKFC